LTGLQADLLDPRRPWGNDDLPSLSKPVEAFTLQKFPDRDSWLEAHQTAIGGSASAAVMGASAWESPYVLWARMSGLLGTSDEESEAMLWGNLLEPVIADEWARRTDRELVDHGRFTIARSTKYPELIATVDRVITSVVDGPGLLEVKTTNAFNLKEWDEEPPEQYQIQLQHQLLVTGYRWGYLCCLIGGQKLKWWKTEREDKYLEVHLRECLDMVRRVRENDPPEVDGHESTAIALRRRYTEDPNKPPVVLSPELVSADETLLKIGDRLKLLSYEKERLRNLIRNEMGEATVGLLPGGARWTHKSSKAGVKALKRSGSK